MKNLLYILLLILFSIKTQAQITGDNYPVQAHVFVNGAGSLKLSDYFTSSTKLSVDLILKDLTKSSLDVYLSWEIEGLGLGIQAGSSPGFVPGSFISLNRGSVRKLNGLDLREYFQPGVVLAAGLSETAIFSGSLPEGFYVLRVRAYEAGTGREVSNRAETYFSVAYALPPVLNQPLNASEFAVTRPQNVPLQWTPRHTSTGSNLVTYQIKVCEVSEDEEPNVAVLGSQTCFTVPQQTATSYLLKASDLPLKPGKRYAWQVQATDLNGALEFQNTGFSEVAWFRFGKACTAPEGLAVAEIGPNRVNLSWKADPQAIGYKVYYKNETAADWQTLSTFGTSFSINGLDKKEPYSFKISTLCDIDNESPTSPEETWEAEEIDTELQDLIDAVLHPLDQISSTSSIVNSNNTVVNASSPDLPATKAATEPLPTSIADLIPTDPTKIPCASHVKGYENCSDSHDDVNVLGTVALPSLVVGDPLTIYDMLAIVTEVSGSDGVYSGKALVKLPFLDDLMMSVEFSNVSVIQEDPAIRGGCVTNVPSNGFFRARTGLSREELKAEEVALIDQIRKARDPESTYTTLGQQIVQYDQTSQEIADATAAGESLTTEQKEALLAQTIALNSQMSNWLENAAELIGGTAAGDAILAQIQAILDQLTANQAAIEAGTSFPSLPNLGSTIAGITDQIRNLLDTPPADTPRIQNLQANNITDHSATLTWQGDKRFTKYIVTLQKPGEGVQVFEVGNTKLEVGNLTNASDYVYSVVGYVGEEKTDESPQQFFSTLDNIFPKPKNINSSKLGETSVKLTWDKEALHLKYKLKYTDKEGNERFAYPTSNEVTLADLDPDMDYPFELFAIGAANQTASELGQFSTEIKCNLSLTLTSKYNESRITDGLNLLSLAGCLNSLGEMGTIKWANTSGLAEENTSNGKMVFPDGQEAEKALGFGLALYLQKDDYYTAYCTINENGKNKTCTATMKAAQISNNGDHCSDFNITTSNSNPSMGENITLQAQGCDNGEVFWPEFNKSSDILNIEFKSNITLHARCSKNELPSCETQITLNENPNCDFLIRPFGWVYSDYPYSDTRAEKMYDILKMPLQTDPITIETEGRETFVYTSFDNTNDPYFLVQSYASKMSKTLTIRIKQGTCTKEIIEYGTANKCFHKKITEEAYSDHVKYKVDNCEGTIVWQDGSTDNSYKLFQADMPTKPYQISATCTEKNRTCVYSDVFSLYNNNLKPEFTICINQYKGKDQLVEIPEMFLYHDFVGACDPPKVCDITGFDETPTILSTSGCSGQIIWLNGLNQKVEQVAADQKVIIDGYYNKPGLYKANCVESGSITQKEIYLLKNSTGCLEVNSSSKKIQQGQEVHLEGLGCTNPLSWYDGNNEKMQEGSLLAFRPKETDTYTAQCTSPECEQQITIEVEPCKLQITSSKGQSLKVLQPTTLELTGCLGEVIWRQDTETLASETNSIVVRPRQTATYTANCLAGECETQIELKVESTPPPPIICEELTLMPVANPAPECEKLTITAEGCTNGSVTWTSSGQNYSTTQNHKIDFDVVGSQTSISATCKKSGFPETTASITVPTQLCLKVVANPSSIEANKNTLVKIVASSCTGSLTIKDMVTGISEAMTSNTKEVRLNGPRTYELTCQKDNFQPKTTAIRIDISVPRVPRTGESAYQEDTDCGNMYIINKKVCVSGNCVENQDLNPLVYSNAGISPGKYSFKAEASGCTTPIQWEWSDGTITKTSIQENFEVFPNATGWLRLSCNGCTKSIAIYVDDPWECETFRLTTGISSRVEKNVYGESVIVYQNTNYCPSFKGVEWFSKSGANLVDYLGNGPVIESTITKVYALCEINGNNQCEAMLSSTFGSAPPATDLSSARVSSTEQPNTTATATTTSNCPADATVSLQNAMAGYLSHLVCENIYLMGNDDGSFSQEKATLFYKSLKSSLTEAYPAEAENFVFDLSETEAVALFQSQYTAKIANPSATCTTGDALAAGFSGETTMGNFENMRKGYEDVEEYIFGEQEIANIESIIGDPLSLEMEKVVAKAVELSKKYYVNELGELVVRKGGIAVVGRYLMKFLGVAALVLDPVEIGHDPYDFPEYSEQIADDLLDARHPGDNTIPTATDVKPKDKGPRRYVTYIKINNSGGVYSGRASGPISLTDEQIVRLRDSRHHKTEQGYGSAQLFKGSNSKYSIRGLEQQMIDYNGCAKSDGGSSGNDIRGISKFNLKCLIYHTSSNLTFGSELHEQTCTQNCK